MTLATQFLLCFTTTTLFVFYLSEAANLDKVQVPLRLYEDMLMLSERYRKRRSTQKLASRVQNENRAIFFPSTSNENNSKGTGNGNKDDTDDDEGTDDIDFDYTSFGLTPVDYDAPPLDYPSFDPRSGFFPLPVHPTPPPTIYLPPSYPVPVPPSYPAPIPSSSPAPIPPPLYVPPDKPVKPMMPAMPYSFSWEVEDEENSYAMEESHDGTVMTGMYRVLLPDGRVQVVTYYDDGSGYKAEVTYE